MHELVGFQIKFENEETREDVEHPVVGERTARVKTLGPLMVNEYITHAYHTVDGDGYQKSLQFVTNHGTSIQGGERSGDEQVHCTYGAPALLKKRNALRPSRDSDFGPITTDDVSAVFIWLGVDGVATQDENGDAFFFLNFRAGPMPVLCGGGADGIVAQPGVGDVNIVEQPSANIVQQPGVGIVQQPGM